MPPPRNEAARPGTDSRTGSLLQDDRSTTTQTGSVRDSAITDRQRVVAGCDPLGGGDDLAEPQLRRALPTWAINTLGTGVKGSRPDARRVWGEFVSIAMSARRRGWTEFQFLDEVWSQETRIVKGGNRVFGFWPLTVQLMSSVKGSMTRAHRQIDGAWLTAGDNLMSAGTLTTTEEFINAAIENAQAWLDRLDENLDGLSVTQTLVMRYVSESVIKRRNSKVTCPCREVGSATGMAYRTANYTLRELAGGKGFLILHDRGAHSEDPKYWRAAIYSLGEVPS
jgi:hypothetical protein